MPPVSLHGLADQVAALETRVERVERIEKRLIKCIKAVWVLFAPPLVGLLVQRVVQFFAT